MSEYELPRDGVDAQVKQAKDTNEAIRDLRGSNTAESIVVTGTEGFVAIDPDTDIRVQIVRGQIAMYGFSDEVDGQHALIKADDTVGQHIIQIHPAWFDGIPDDNSLTLQGNREGVPGLAQLYSDGLIDLFSPSVQIDTSQLALYSLPTTSATANLHLGTVGGEWTVAYITSSQRYKTDITDADIDPEAVLRWIPRTWRDKTEVEAIGDDATQHIGFIAEEIHDETPEFVVLDGEGRPDSLKYDRMVAGLHAVVKAQADQIATLTARIDALEAP